MPSKSQSILLGAAVYVVVSLALSFIALNGGQGGQYLTSALCCLFAIVVPGIAVWHYTNTYRVTIPAGTGAGIGALAIVLGGAVSYAIQKVLQAVGAFPSDAEIMERTREQLALQGLEPEQIEQAMSMGELFQGVGGFAINLVIAAVIGAIAGAVAASIFKKGDASAEI